MKHHFKYLFFLLLLPALFACEKIKDNSHYDHLLPEVQEPEPPTGNETLKDIQGWTIDSLADGLIHYQFSKYVQTQTANQFVNVVELDLLNPDYQLEFISLSGRDSLSSVAKDYDAVIGINGTYEMDASFIKTNGNVISPITLSEGHLRYWKHEGAVFYNNNADIKIAYGTKESYRESPYMNIFSAAPVLIDDYKKVGEDFIGDVTGINLNSLDYEDYRRHQGVRHPRTVVALTEKKKLLLITIDGRFAESAGMTAKEVTGFLVNYFGPQYALNMDGGGSTTMFVKDKGVQGIVNYPTDNGVRNHYGQRLLRTFILVKKKSEGSQFAGGDGTEGNPYLIANAKHLENMHELNWSETETKPYYFKLIDDVNMAGKSWRPVNNVDPYSRYLHFDGNGHIIKNLTVEKTAYGSLFGVLLGSCKNLGLVNANVESSNGGGAFAGYLGLKSPNIPQKTGLLENCFSTGQVTGTDAVGGLIGNIGKPNGTSVSKISNSFSTATVIATNKGSSNSRAGGLAGIVFDEGVVTNSFAAGTVLSGTSSGKGAGGIVGWSDSRLVNLIALNDTVRNEGEGNAGRISAAMGSIGGKIMQGENCWASDKLVVIKGGNPVPASAFVTGEVTVSQGAYDGETKSASFLGDIGSYQSILNWDVGAGKTWASQMHKGMPVLQWLYARGDYADYY